MAARNELDACGFSERTPSLEYWMLHFHFFLVLGMAEGYKQDIANGYSGFAA